MRSLFVRIFLWFWLAMAVVVVVLVVTSPLFTRSRPGVEDWQRGAEDWARTTVDRVAAHVEEVGVDEPPMGRGRGPGHGRRDRGDRPPAPARVFVLDDQARLVHGDDAPPEVFEIAQRTLDTGVEASERAGMLHLLARPVTAADGSRVVVVAAHDSPPRLIHLIEPKALAWRLGVLFLVVGGLSFWLARYLSSPVPPLRAATRALKDGDLSARVEGRVTKRRDEIGELARDFDAMAERIEGLVASQRRLLRDVSHELRSPLARLVVALELARSRAGDEAGGALDRIEREAARLEELIGQLLLLERLEAGEVDGEETAIDLGSLVGDVVADAGFEATADGTEVRFGGGAARIVGREGLLRSAFDNILRNAVHHTGGGSVVDVELDTEDGDAVVSIRDRGPGVAEEELEKIFDPFYRVGEARDRASGGAGLGLAIAARAVRVHGGRISAQNHPEGGLLITVHLPA